MSRINLFKPRPYIPEDLILKMTGERSIAFIRMAIKHGVIEPIKLKNSKGAYSRCYAWADFVKLHAIDQAVAQSGFSAIVATMMFALDGPSFINNVMSALYEGVDPKVGARVTIINRKYMSSSGEVCGCVFSSRCYQIKDANTTKPTFEQANPSFSDYSKSFLTLNLTSLLTAGLEQLPDLEHAANQL